MSSRGRLALFLLGAAGVAVLFATAFLGMPAFGSEDHPYRDLAVPAAVRHATANVVSSVNFDQRGIDTFGEETIVLGSVIGVAALLRPAQRESEQRPPPDRHRLESTTLLGYVLLPVTLVVGLDVVAHGHVSPGGGFQGGVILATGFHLLYLAGSYQALARLRPVEIFDRGEALGAGLFGVLGAAGLAATGAFLANVIPTGSFGQLFSGGTVPVLNVLVGLEVSCGAVVLLTHFFTEAITLSVGGRRERGGGT
ncbi:sodium:proton antiporter [Wenjunlia vitaminophila]|uniref:Sodium:proton antiporter n=1 Tax=Wenjunlia vitaminophila TaxID=76728 RepID=A0A0T6LY18_WENVI|nr:MnhB domain-containing protein [Wenjunlia vitaminophila]KRV50902.1 sodium:proton antiporter [Wenjunlia vitaminophila]